MMFQVSCQLLGGHLVEVETKVEADHLKTIVQSKGKRAEKKMGTI